MRNLKKFLALVLATLMVISAAATVSAYSDVADDDTYAAAIAALTEYGIVNGTNTELDTFSPDDDVVRYQMALMMARALEPKTTDWQNGMAIFEDVTEWYGAIAYAYMNGIVTGMDATHFEPKTGIKCRDALIMAVRALGYEVDVTLTPYWIGAYQTAAKIGLTNNLKVNDPAKTLTRAETAQVIYNMLKATPADGGATIEEKNFGVAGDNNVTTFVITATPNQAYADGAKSVEDGYVGIQLLTNGIPTGGTMYIPVEKLGIEAKNADTYFNYSVDLVNYNANSGLYEKAILGAAPTVVYSNDVDVNKDAGKITINGVTYYTTSEFTGAALKNEIVIFNGGLDAKDARVLLKKDGNIIDAEGNVKAIFVRTAGNGINYYAYVVDGKTYTVTETEALDKFGVTLPGTYTEYSTIAADGLKSNYQLSLFDDDGDQKFDRAIYTAVSLSVYTAPDDNGKCTVKGPADGVKDVKIVGDTLKKGDVFVYTYNKQLKTITVIEKLAVQNGVVNGVNLTDYKKQDDAKKNYLATVKVDGVNYKIGNTAQEQFIGATLYPAGDFAKFGDIADGKLNYTNSDLALSDVTLKFANIESPIRYIEFNGYIIAAETYDVEEAFEYMTVVSADDMDGNGIYVQAYVGGKLGTYHITSYKDSNNEIVKFADLSVFKLNAELANFAKDIEGAVFKAVINTEDDTVQVSQRFNRLTPDLYNPEKVEGVWNGYWNKSFKLFRANDYKYEFVNGNSIENENSGKENRLRTNDDTKFYFINTDKDTVSVYIGKASDKFSIDTQPVYETYLDKNNEEKTRYLGAVSIFADKMGFGEDSTKNGVAKNVFVYYNEATKDNIKGFNLSSITNAIVYIAAPGTYEVGGAADFDLTGKSGTYYKYGAVALNMANGKKLDNVYTPKKVLKQGFYEVDGMGIISENPLSVGKDGDRIQEFTFKSIDLANEYITVVDNNDYEILDNYDEVTTLITTVYDKIDLKTNKKDNLTAGITVRYLADDTADGIVVFIIGAEGKDEGTETNVSAKWVGASKRQYVAVADVTEKSTTKIAGSAYVAVDADGNNLDFEKNGGWSGTPKVKGAWKDLKAETYAPKNADITLLNKDLEERKIDLGETEVTIKDGVVTFVINADVVTGPFGEEVTKIPAGNSFVKIAFHIDNDVAYFLIPVTIE